MFVDLVHESDNGLRNVDGMMIVDRMSTLPSWGFCANEENNIGASLSIDRISHEPKKSVELRLCDRVG